MAKDLFKPIKDFDAAELSKSKGILDDHSQRKSIWTQELFISESLTLSAVPANTNPFNVWSNSGNASTFNFGRSSGDGRFTITVSDTLVEIGHNNDADENSAHKFRYAINTSSTSTSKQHIFEIDDVDTFKMGSALNESMFPMQINSTDTGGAVDNALSLRRGGVEFMAIGEYLNLYNGIRLPVTNGPNIFFGIANDTATDFDSYFIAGATELVMQAPTTITLQIGLANTLVDLTSSNFHCYTNLEIDGALNHDGTTVGFYNVTPVARPSAYTQTYSTTTRTHANPTSATLTDSTTGSADTTVGKIADGGETTTNADINDNFADVVAQINALRVDLLNLKQLVNSIIDDDQSQGLKQ